MLDPDEIPVDLLGAQNQRTPNRINVLAFHDYVENKDPFQEPFVVTTSSRFDGVLGLFDQLAIQIVVDDVNAPVLSVSGQIFHSADGINWVPKYSVPEIPDTQLETGHSHNFFVPDDGGFPSLAFVTFRMSFLSAGPMRARVKCTITCNDVHERDFARDEMNYFLERSGCRQFIPGGGMMTPQSVVRLSDSRVLDWMEPVFPNFTDYRTDLNMTPAERAKAMRQAMGPHYGRMRVMPNDIGMGMCIGKDGYTRAFALNPRHLTPEQIATYLSEHYYTKKDHG